MKSTAFNLDALKKETTQNNRYERRISAITAGGKEVVQIKSVVENAVTNVANDQKSFVIYGEPQSGKTEMMNCLDRQAS